MSGAANSGLREQYDEYVAAATTTATKSMRQQQQQQERQRANEIMVGNCNAYRGASRCVFESKCWSIRRRPEVCIHVSLLL